jgi:hypothetical protein
MLGGAFEVIQGCVGGSCLGVEKLETAGDAGACSKGSQHGFHETGSEDE